MLKIWHYLSYDGHFYLCVQGKTNAFWMFTYDFGSSRRFPRVVTFYKWASRDAVVSLLSVDIL